MSTRITKEELKNRLLELKTQYPKRWVSTKAFELIKEDVYLYTKHFDKFDACWGERINIVLNDITDRPKCYCGKYVNYRSILGYNIYCSNTCSQNKTEVRQKIINTCIERYGVEFYSQTKEHKEKTKNTNLIKFGVESPLQSKKIKQKKIDTCLIIYGVEHPWNSEEVQEKYKQTNLEKYGVEFYSQTDDYIKKSRNTCLEKYGVEHPQQNEEIFNKNCSFKKKKYVFSSGRIEFVQGYEPQILDELVKHFDEDDIICGKNLPEIWYGFEEKQHRYFPDIYIKSRNMIIEVKSDYTMEVDLNKNLAKRQACLDAGYNFWFTIGK